MGTSLGESQVIVDKTGVQEISLPHANGLATASLPSVSPDTQAALRSITNNGVTRTQNIDGSVTYSGYGLEGTVTEVTTLSTGAKGIKQSFTISNAPQYKEASDIVKKQFKEQYPDEGDYYIVDYSNNLKGGTVITILDKNGKAVSGKDYEQHERLGKKHSLELAPSDLRPGLTMFHLLKRAFYEFKDSNGRPLEYSNSSNRHDIGSVDDPAGLGNYVLRFKAESGSGWSPGLYVLGSEVYDCGYSVAFAYGGLSAAFVLSVPESKS